MGAEPRPGADLDVTLDLVRELLAAQHPDLATLPLGVLANGWDNLMCRLGDELVVRLPRRALAAELVVHEQRWLPELARRLPLPVPAPVRVGRPGGRYPWSWSVLPFLPGQMAATTPLADPHEAAVVLGGFLGALHRPAPPDAPANPYRGVPLARRDAETTGRLERMADVLGPAAAKEATRVWRSALARPTWREDPRWLHGDLHPANILVDAGRISAIVDFGDMTGGDPATDLAVAWTLLPADHRHTFRLAYDTACERGGGAASDDDTWMRARGWALALSLAYVAHSADDPLMAGIGTGTLDAVLEPQS